MLASSSSAPSLLLPIGGIHEKAHVLPEGPQETASPMDSKRVWEWYKSHPLLIGFNYLPRTAVNFMEMWHPSTFNAKVIDQELEWAVERGYNSLRTNIPMALYEEDAEGLTRRINEFLDICHRHGISVMLCPMDDCEFGGGSGSVVGPQEDPIPGVHNSRAIGSPGRAVILDPSQWHRVEDYVRYMVRTWGGDSRVLVWDLWNEPGNSWEFTPNGTRVIEHATQFEENALRLMELVFQWAREEFPLQPLTSSAWHVPDPFFDDIQEDSSPIIALSHPIDQRAMQLSDIITIHAYCGKDLMRSILTKCSLHNKPMMLTEWMARHAESTFESLLPILEEFQVGCYQWGLVQGRSQTHLPWPHVAERFQDSTMWFHDVLNPDGTAHDETEMTYLKEFSSTVQDRILAARGKLVISPATVPTNGPTLNNNTLNTIITTNNTVVVPPPIHQGIHLDDGRPLAIADAIMTAVVGNTLVAAVTHQEEMEVTDDFPPTIC